MRLAPFQLTDYFVTSLSVVANQNYDPKAESGLSLESLEVIPRSRPDENDPRKWVVELSITQDVPEGKNIPYRFSIEMVGFVEVHPDWPAEKIDHAVGCNGPSMLFGAAREIIRAATGRGPFGPMLIPSATFFSPPPANPEIKQIQDSPVPDAPPAKSKPAKRKTK
jgi:preprotein translocase subunit SecB